jgi:SOS response regulatory protein OraA/RecX
VGLDEAEPAREAGSFEAGSFEAGFVEAGAGKARVREAGALEAGALEAGLASLRYRDLSERELDRKLAERGFDGEEREEAVATLRRTGLLDERRFAENRARSLASRAAGDALIRYELERAGVGAELIEESLAVLEPEHERARAVVGRRGAGAKTARYLAAKGFAPEVVSEAVASIPEDELG